MEGVLEGWSGGGGGWACVEFPLDPQAEALEFRAEFADQPVLAFAGVAGEAVLPLVEPLADAVFEFLLGGESGFAAGAGDRLDLLGEAVGFLDVAGTGGVDFVADFLDFLLVAFFEDFEAEHEDAVFLRGGEGGERSDARLQLVEAAFDAFHLTTDEDFANPFDLPRWVWLGWGMGHG